MAQPLYPTLGVNPDQDNFVREPAYDPAQRTPMEDGSLLVMAKQTKVPLRWSLIYRYLSGTNKALIDASWEDDANYGAIPIKFTDPTNSTDYFVRYASMPRSALEDDGQATWRVQVDFIEALGTYT